MGLAVGTRIIERLESDDFNPNVSLEVGHMIGLRKPVCLLKDKTLKMLQTDLMGKLYRTFDPQDAHKSVMKPLEDWASDKGIIATEQPKQ